MSTSPPREPVGESIWERAVIPAIPASGCGVDQDGGRLTGHALTRQLRRFIVEHLETDTDLDVLLVLQRHPENCWDAVRLAGVLRIHRDQADQILARMAANGLARADQSRYRYEPATANLARSVAILAALHPTYRVAIRRVMFGESRRAPAALRGGRDATRQRPIKLPRPDTSDH